MNDVVTKSSVTPFLNSNHMPKLIVDKKYFVCYCNRDNLIKVSYYIKVF